MNIMNKITFIMNILKSIFIAAILWLSFVQTASANLVLNPFFAGSAATATNWTSSATGNGASFNVNTRPVNATITAAGGATEFYSGCQTATCLTFPFVTGTSSGAQQAIPTVIGTTYKLSFWVYSSAASAPGGPIEIAVYWGTTKVPVTAPVGWSLQTTTFTATATSTNLTVLIRDDPSWSAITYMDIEPVVLQLAKTNPPSFAVGVPANYTLTATNISSPAVTSGTSFTIRDQLPPNIQYNSAAAGAGVTSVTCAASGTVAAGQLVTCTVNVTAGIAPSGTGTITINVTPQAASAGVAGINKASLEFGPSLTTAPSTCTGTDAPVLGCAVAASITPTAAQLAFSKTVNVICDPINGPAASGAKNIPGAAVQYALNVANTGTAVVVLSTVTDLLQLVGPSGIVFDPKLNSGALPAANCVSGNVANTLSATGFSAVSGVGVGPGPTPTTATPNAVTVGATAAGQTVTIKYSGAGLIAGTGIPGWTGTLGIGNYITVYFNAFVQ